jgi:hypothetical protein
MRPESRFPVQRRRVVQWVALTSAAATLVYVVLLLFQVQRDGLILWPRAFDASLIAIGPLIGAVVLYAACALTLLRAWSDAPTRGQKALLTLLVIFGGAALQWAAVRVTHEDVLAEIMRRTYAWKTGGYWTVGAGVVDLRDFIGGYVERAASYPVHQMRHPPGLSLIFWVGTKLFEAMPAAANAMVAWLAATSCQSLVRVDVPAAQMASGAFGAFVEIAAAQAVVAPLYALVRRVGGARAAAAAALLYALTPGFGLWVSQFDRGIALFTPLILWMCERFVQSRRGGWMLAAGTTLSFATFLTFGAAPIGLIAAVYTVVRTGWIEFANLPSRLRSVLLDLVRGGALAVIGAASIWIVAYVATGLDVFALYHVIFDSHLGIEFPFWPFVVWHPWDLLTMAGLATAVPALLAFVRGCARRPSEADSGKFALAAAFVVPLAMLSVLHVARGETGRVWLYFVPIAVAATALLLRDRATMFAVFALLSLHTGVQNAVLRVHEYGFMPETLPQASVPAAAVTVDTRFGASGQIALLAYEIDSLTAGKEGAIRLYWQRMSDEPLQTSFRSFVHVAVDLDDQMRVAQANGLPMREAYPTTCWAKGQVVVDEQRFGVNADAAPGEYPVFVGLFDPLDGQRPPTFASLPAQQMHGSVLLPTRGVVQGSR